ncbi:AfsR/SARP family transcriptional regulator [Plantactinospora siamensis]|uniref:AfsR/SARP family transcriptional regulator n=1 Tax=Plantactinospora siamensis TaxID=555372 RepID=UPI00406BAD02
MPVELRGPRHRAVLARLIVARGRVVPVDRLVEDLWTDPPPGAVSAVRTFVAALRRAVEPGRAPRQPARLLVTEGPGYALRAAPDTVDAWRFSDAVAAASAASTAAAASAASAVSIDSAVSIGPPASASGLTAPEGSPAALLAGLDRALGWWRGPAYAGLDEAPWALAERSRLDELRLRAVELRAEALLALGRPAEVVPELDAQVADRPWREESWRLLALALYRADRQGDALAVLRRAGDLLRDQLGIDPGPRLRRLETDILRQSAALLPQAAPAADRLWARAAAAYDSTVAAGTPARLDSTVGLLRSLAVTGGTGLAAAREQRFAAIAAAERRGDPEITARVIGGYDVPAIWSRSDDPALAARIVAAAERALAALPPGSPEATRVRLLATVAVESRGASATRGPAAAREAERIARRLGDPALLAFALNGVFLQTFHRAGLAPDRDRIGVELVALGARHGLVNFEILGHLVRLQARAALGDVAGADGAAAAADRLAERHDRPLVRVFTRWYRALRLALTGAAEAAVESAYRDAAGLLPGAGMPGVERGLLPLALLCLRVWHDRPADFAEDTDWGPYAPWARPLVLVAAGRRDAAAAALRRTPEPPPDLLFEALWSLTGRAAEQLGDRTLIARARHALAPAAAEHAGAGSGMLTAGPVAGHLARLDAALRHTP